MRSFDGWKGNPSTIFETFQLLARAERCRLHGVGRVFTSFSPSLNSLHSHHLVPSAETHVNKARLHKTSHPTKATTNAPFFLRARLYEATSADVRPLFGKDD